MHISNLTPPLVVDLDNTLTRTDTLIESLVLLAKRSPQCLFLLPYWLVRGRAYFKTEVASRVSLSPSGLPYNEELIAYLKKEKSKGRRIVLATAAHFTIAKAVADFTGIFDEVIATDAGLNLKGGKKLERIQESVGTQFVYAGDSRSDIEIWKDASAAILVCVPKKTASKVRSLVPIEREFRSQPFSLRTWIRAFRVYQWVKNSLVFVPLMTAFLFTDVSKVIISITAFLSFSLCASATYVFNDLWDLQSDRAHPRKRSRPLASGQISLVDGVTIAFLVLVSGLLVAKGISLQFLLVIVCYLFLTVFYSLALKEYVLLDVIILSVLFTMRIVAGSVALGVETSAWLLAFSIFIFLSLALVKRCSELVSLVSELGSTSRGRDYDVKDLVILWPLGVGSAISSIVVFGLFISSSATQDNYATPQLLWIVALILFYWLSRLWIKTARGEMHDDPIVYAFKNRGSQITIVAALSVVIFAHTFSLGSII